MMTREELERTYLDSFYSVFYNGRQYEVIIGESPAEMLEALSENSNIQSGIILTAWNPQSQVCSLAENQKNNAKLSEYLISNDATYYAALGRARNSSWQEESFFIVNISKDDSERLAIKYDQNAYVWLEQNKPTELIFSTVWKNKL